MRRRRAFFRNTQCSEQYLNMITLYHNNKCSKCREVLEILKNSNKEFKIVEYLENPPSAELLESLLIQLKLEPEQIVRTGEDE